MADLTDADKKSFIDIVIGTIKDADNKALLITKEWDPTQRTTNLANGVVSVTNDEGIISGIEAALKSANDSRRADLDNNYELASATVDAVQGALGKDHPLVKKLRQARGAMSRDSKTKKTAAPGK